MKSQTRRGKTDSCDRRTEIKIFAEFLGIDESRAELGLKLAEDSQSCVALAQLAKEEDQSKFETKAIAQILVNSDRRIRAEILRRVKCRRKDVMASVAARRAQIALVKEVERSGHY